MPVLRIPILKTCLALPLLLLATGCAVKPPGTVETKLITAVKHHVTIGGGGQRNPLPADADYLHRGREAYGSYCFACHGMDGQKTGVPFAENMSPPIPSLASADVQSYSDGQLKWIIQNGIQPSGMPAARGILNDDEMWAIVLYLRHLPAAGSLGEPPSYTGDNSTPAHTP